MAILNGSSSFLQVTKTPIKAWMTLLFCQLQQLTTELAALECLKFNVSTFSRLLLIFADKEEMHNILDVFKCWPDWTTYNRVTCPCLDYQKYIYLVENYLKYFYDLLAHRLAIVALRTTCFIYEDGGFVIKLAYSRAPVVVFIPMSNVVSIFSVTDSLRFCPKVTFGKQPFVPIDGDLGDLNPYNTEPSDTQRLIPSPITPPHSAPCKRR